MTKKIDISKNILQDLYLKQELSTYQIAKKFDCDPTVIQKRLKEHNIKIRYPKKKIDIQKQKLHNLYINRKFSTQKIAKLLGIGSCTVYYKLKDLNIPTRPKKIVKIPKERLKKLYFDKKLPLSKIARLYGCTSSVVLNKMKKNNLIRRNLSKSNTIYSKKEFSGDKGLKAYMIGFRLGDLHVRVDSNESSIIRVGSNTTKSDQFDLIKEVYGVYGHFWCKRYEELYSIIIHLDKSFKFLLPKEDNVPSWILKSNKYFFAFLGGYTDAEGNISISQGRARFRIRSCDKNILFQIYNKLNLLNINTKFWLVCKKRAFYNRKYNKDCWGIFVNSKESLLKLLKFLRPYIKHKKRFNDLVLAKKNIIERNKKHGVEVNFMKDKKTFYITTTIPYANASPHIGFALEIIQADVLARWNFLKGKDVFFLTGTDEHGVKNYQTAKKEGLTPQEFVDKNSREFKKLTNVLNISNNYFIRTTDKKVHWPGVIKLWKILFKRGDIYKKKYTGAYCSGCERFITEKELKDGKCPNHPNLKIEKISEENYFFKLSKYSDEIVELIKTNKLKIQPEKWRNDFLSLIKDGLTDVSFSRDRNHLPWGIPVPGDEDQVMYVWPDALSNYLTGIGFPNKKFEKYWPVNIHVVGKDMLRFHTGIWPGMLLSAGLPLPKEVIVHGFLTVDGQKMSKSLGNVIDPLKLAEKYSSDSVRYVLMRSIPFGEDGDFSEKVLIERHNNELANKLGNLVSRVTSLAEKYGVSKCENKLFKKLKLKEIEKLINNYELDKALNLIFSFIDVCNEYVQNKKPWETKDKKVLYELVDSIKAIAILLWSFIPSTSEKIAKQIGFKIKFNEISKPIKVGKVKKGEILFRKI